MLKRLTCEALAYPVKKDSYVLGLLAAQARRAGVCLIESRCYV